MYPPERSKRSKLDHHAYKHHQSWSNTSGLVAIQVETTLFKIYGPTFAHHSPFFTQLLQPAPHGDAKRAKIEGLNLYEIESVSARDFELLIRAIDDAIQYNTSKPPFETVAAILRASTLLKFPHFRAFAIDTFQRFWSTGVTPFVVTPLWQNYAAETIVLARKYDVPAVIKRALYELCSRTVINKNDIQLLSTADIHLVFAAQKCLASATLSLAVKFKHTHCIITTNGLVPGDCKGFNPINITAAWWEKHVLNPLFCLDYYQNVPRGQWCNSCDTITRWQCIEEAGAIWEKLEEWFELDN